MFIVRFLFLFEFYDLHIDYTNMVIASVHALPAETVKNSALPVISKTVDVCINSVRVAV